MTQFYTYRDGFGVTNTFGVALGNAVIRLGEIPGWQERAEHMQSGSCEVVLDDPDANVGHSGDAILGNQRFVVTETACSAQMTYTGIIGTRRYGRGDGTRASLRTGASRQISIELHDSNALASARVIPHTDEDGDRPAETVSQRMSWLLGSGYLSLIADNGLVASNTTTMDANDYRGQRAVQIVNDCEQAAGFGWNAFVYWDDTAAHTSLFFGNSNVSTAFTSTLKLSDVLADLDTFTDSAALTFGVFNAELTRDPTELGDSVYLPYKNGVVFRTRAATTATYGQKDLIAPNANVRTRNRARTVADNILFQHRNEEDRITCTVELPPSKVNLLRAGHRVLAKFSHLPGYEGWTWFRVLMRAPGNIKETDDRYTVQLELSPQEGGCSVTPTRVQDHYMEGVESPTRFRTYSFDAASNPGNLIILTTLSSNGALDVVSAPSGWTWAVQNELLDTGAPTGYRGNVFYKKSEGETNVTVQFNATGASTQPRGVLIEYAGLTNPTLDSVTSMVREHNLGLANAPTIPYPAGAAVVLSVGFFPLGPGSGDHLTEVGSGALVYGLVPDPPGTGSIDGHAAAGGGAGAPGGANVYGAGVGKIGAIQQFQAPADTASSASGWQFLFTDNGWTMTAGLVFTGDNCE